MSQWQVKSVAEGCRALMNSKEVQADILERAEKVAARASTFGSGNFYADVQAGKVRAWALVKPEDYMSIVSNAKHNSLVKSLDAAR